MCYTNEGIDNFWILNNVLGEIKEIVLAEIFMWQCGLHLTS